MTSPAKEEARPEEDLQEEESTNQEVFQEEKSEKPDDREKIIEALAKQRGIKRKKMHKQKRKPVLTVRCPHGPCQKPVYLICPYCSIGQLHVDEDFLTLSCENCYNTLRQLNCGECGFAVRPTYIRDKQKELRVLKERSDFSKFPATILVFLGIMFIIWSIMTIYS